MLPTTLQMARLRAPLRRASRSAASVSAVSPDCVMTTTSVRPPDDRVPVAELGAVVHLDRQVRQLLDQELPDQAGVPRGAAGDDADRVDGRRVVGHVAEEHASRVERHPAEDGLADGLRLLVDFLEHEVLVAGLLGHHRVPRHVLRLPRDRRAREIAEGDAAPA